MSAATLLLRELNKFEKCISDVEKDENKKLKRRLGQLRDGLQELLTSTKKRKRVINYGKRKKYE